MKYFSFLFTFLVGVVLHAQSNPIEIIRELKKDLASENDTSKYQANIGIATQFNFVEGQQDSVLYYAGKALEIGERNNILAWKITANYYHGLYHFNYSQDFKRAIHYYEIAKAGVIESNNTRQLSTLYNAIGGCKSQLGDFEGAMEDYMEVYAIAKEFTDYTTLSNTLSNTAILYIQMKQDDKAITTLKESLHYNEKDTTGDQGYSYLNAALNLLDVYVRIDSLDEALSLVRKIEPVADSMQYSIAQDRLIALKINILRKKGKFEELYKVTEQAYYSAKESETHNQNFQALAYEYAICQIELGNFDEAKRVEQEIELQTDQTSVLFQLVKYRGLHNLNSQLGDYESAYHFSERYHTLKDSISDSEKSAKLEDLLKKYELAKKEAEIQENRIEQLRLQKKNSILITILMGLLSLGSVLYLWYFNRRKKEQEEMHQLEQKMLSLQMNPHFIFNAISSIQNYLYDEGDKEKAINHLSTFAILMRQILENSREKFIPLEEEIEFLQNYLNLQKLRFDDKFDFEIQIDPAIDVERVSIPPLLTQPFVENAIEHGKIYAINDGKLLLNITMAGKNLCIDIVDNGVGIESKAQGSGSVISNKKSLSIQITKERLDLLSKLMKNKFSLQIKPNSNSVGTHVRLNIPSIYL